MNELLILVDENDNEIGLMEKMSAHKSGTLHRAFSVFIFNSKGELLLQQRADNKYHSGGLWTNTCCSHPVDGEKIGETIKKRLKEEMGMECETVFQFSFIYKSELDNGLTEHELDHVYFGTSEEEPVINKAEAKDWKYVSLDDLQKAVEQNPLDYSAWLKICLPEVIKKVNQNKIGDL
ncbi:MAG: isopentenyl-diphosphate Delta-isomerase [Ginsengibacter sp.]